MDYKETSPVDRSQFQATLDQGSPEKIGESLLGLVNADPDPGWLQELCLTLINHSDLPVRQVAVTSLGHVARIHRTIDPRVPPILESLRGDPGLGGRAEDALEDVAAFVDTAR
jgi:hypothetical protein